MKINEKIISIPPYVSTSWDQVSAIKAENATVSIILKNGFVCTIAHLEQKTIDDLFSIHKQVLEKKTSSGEEIGPFVQGIQSGFKELIGTLSKLGNTAFASISKMVEHDPQNADLPELPPEMVEKIKLLLQVLSKEEIMAMPPSEPNCNCMYCQITRILHDAVIHEKHPLHHEKDVELVEEKDLEFSEWTVTPLGDSLYTVTNKLDPHEEYRVFLGDPIGCTCGKQNCEHILAVLKS